MFTMGCLGNNILTVGLHYHFLISLANFGVCLNWFDCMIADVYCPIKNIITILPYSQIAAINMVNFVISDRNNCQNYTNDETF